MNLADMRRESNRRMQIQWATLGSGARGSVMVKALCYKPESRGFDTRKGEFF
jgi:hypothetical protein